MSTKNISINDLPARPRGLADDELSNVFGGCSQAGYTCDDKSKCCPGLTCDYGSGQSTLSVTVHMSICR